MSAWRARGAMFAVHTGHLTVIAMGHVFNDRTQNVLMKKVLDQGVLTWSQ